MSRNCKYQQSKPIQEQREESVNMITVDRCITKCISLNDCIFHLRVIILTYSSN